MRQPFVYNRKLLESNLFKFELLVFFAGLYVPNYFRVCDTPLAIDMYGEICCRLGNDFQCKNEDGTNLLTLQERQYLTDILRSQAVKSLPAEQNFTIMTRENINVMLPPGKTIEECEGSCLAETGKNIAADYVAQARIASFGGSLALSVEIYETAGNKLLASFNGRGADVNELEKIIKEHAPDFFKKVKSSGGDWGGATGFSDISGGGEFSVQGKTFFLVDVTSKPAGAALSIDGRPIAKCMATPCKVQVEEGEHRFVLVKERYEDAEQVTVISAGNKNVNLSLEPLFGRLALNPKMVEGVGSASDFVLLVDEKPVVLGKNDLDPGIHSVKVSHPCYDPMEFKVGIQKKKTERFEEQMVRGKGGLKLDAEKEGERLALPVFFDGKEVGSTPFHGEVPLCATVAVGEGADQQIVDVSLKWHETVEYVHQMKDKAAEHVGESVPTNIEPEKHQTHWVLISVSAATIVGGTVLAIVENHKAKSTYEDGAETAKEYKKRKDDIDSAQLLRGVGIGAAVLGAVGLGLSIAF